jgi:hypothetical protein
VNSKKEDEHIKTIDATQQDLPLVALIKQQVNDSEI